MSGFAEDMTLALRQAKRNAMAWQGALQHAVFSAPEAATDSKAKGKVSPEAWFSGVNAQMEGALQRAEMALEDDAGKRRGAKYGAIARDAFAREFQDHVQAIGDVVLGVHKDIRLGMLKSSPAIRQSSHALRTDISQMIAVYDHHLDGVGLASLRTKIEGPPDMKVGGRE